MKFFVGQRVKLVRPLRRPERAGLEFRIKGFGFWPKDGKRRLCDCTIELDSGNVVAAFQIEPILPSGHCAGEEGHCEPLDKLLSEVSRETV